MIPKTLSMLKMEKNFRAHIEKKYARMPYRHYDLNFWLYRIKQETKELEEAINLQDFENIREELADISNLVDYAFETSFIKELMNKPLVLGSKGLAQLFEHNKKLGLGD